MISSLIHPRTLIDSLLTYPRFLGAIKPSLLDRTESELEARLACARSGWWPIILRHPIGKSILALSPHPDDETIGAGGLLLAHRGKANISVITVFNGDKGGVLPESETAEYKSRLAATRKRELEAACKHFLGKVIGGLDLPDGTVPSSLRDSGLQLRELVEGANADVVILPWLLDRNADHRTTNLLWATACADVRCMILSTELWSLIPCPNAYFDITDFLQHKLAAISEFRTQLAAVDYINLVKGLAGIRGFHSAVRECRAGAAEAFFCLPNHDYCDLVLRAVR